jgi:citrate synthase
LTPAKGGKEIIPESMLWLLLTGNVPSEQQTRDLSRQLAENGDLPKRIEQLVDAYVAAILSIRVQCLYVALRFPRTLHPMTQLGMGVAALNHDSKFAAAYERGVKKTEYWTYTLEDSLDLVAKLPALAARIYRNAYHPGKAIPGINKDLDLVGM